MSVRGCIAALAVFGCSAVADAQPRLVVLRSSGEMRDGLPVVHLHPDAGRYERVLTRGFSGRLLRLYELEQRARHPDRDPEPAYLCLTGNQGGFPRNGFVLDGTPRMAAFVDLHERSTLTGRHGAVDQIFPHELMHIILQDVAGERGDGRASQVHAIGVATDRLTAFDEGFAEHAQIMAIDDPGAMPETRALAGDAAAYERAMRATDAYRRALTARWSIAPRATLMFPFWFSQSEQVLRYFAVRQNLFAREPDLPRLARDPYALYLLENVLPGAPAAPRKPLARLYSSEGVIAALFFRWVTDARFQRGREGSALETAYLKLFAAFRRHPHDVVSFTRAYVDLFPGERDAVADVLTSVFGVGTLPEIPELWVVNPDMPNGRSLFDQHRAMPRPHAFDLNAASLGDLLGVPGVDEQGARTIRGGGPYRALGELPLASPILAATFKRMADAANRPPAPLEEGGLSFRTLLAPYGRRAALVIAISALAAAFAYRAVRRVRWSRAALNGLVAALTGLVSGWVGDTGSGALGWLAPMAACGVPAFLFAVWRTRSPRRGFRVLAAWALAACVPALVLRPIA